MTPETIALLFAGALSCIAFLFILTCFAPEIRARIRSRPSKGKARKGDRKKETNP